MKIRCPECGLNWFRQSESSNHYRNRRHVELCEPCITLREQRKSNLAHEIEVEKLIAEYKQKTLQETLLSKVKRKLKYIECKDAYSVHRHKRRALLRNAKGEYTKEYIKHLLVKQKNKCIACLKDIAEKYHIDHIYALSKGGGNGEDNIQLLCQPCNNKKHNKDPIEFLQSNKLKTYCEI
jgi:5-methylcytosine-specific restriction endonuclease McrA